MTGDILSGKMQFVALLALLVLFFALKMVLELPVHDALAATTSVHLQDTRVDSLLELWNVAFLNGSVDEESMRYVPHAPHLQDCKKRIQTSIAMDSRRSDGRRPRWSLWRGEYDARYDDLLEDENYTEEMLFDRTTTAEAPYPPWIEGGDGDNLPLTRRIQRDLWVHQHPKNCSDSSIKFLLGDWKKDTDLGTGAQFVAMSGYLAIALAENRILITNYFNRADHEGCVGAGKSDLSCYFLPETSDECKARALKLSTDPIALEKGIITNSTHYNDSVVWFGRVPELWGKPWEHMQPTTQIGHELLFRHYVEDRRWWRAQAVRYLMRFPSEYLCTLLNEARHQAFGRQAADLVIQTLPSKWPEEGVIVNNNTAMEKLVWGIHKPWMPHLISVHVRQGDKSSEMKLYGFDAYMKLAQNLRNRFPHIHSIWLSTEMQSVIDETKKYRDWKFFYTNIKRQSGSTKMRDYEVKLGTMKSSNNAFVNFLVACDCEFFVGALGSTWSFLIDGMRATGGKVMAGFLSVNKDRYWDTGEYVPTYGIWKRIFRALKKKNPHTSMATYSLNLSTTMCIVSGIIFYIILLW